MLPIRGCIGWHAGQLKWKWTMSSLMTDDGK